MKKQTEKLNRRRFLNQLGLGASSLVLPSTFLSFTPSIKPMSSSKNVRFGIVADVHKDLMPDADERLEVFINKARDEQVDFIIQLGDFCMAEPGNKDFMRLWESFKGPRYHVLGNHDMDRQTKQEMLEFWEMPKTYYSFDQLGYHFIVLDANFLYEDGKYTDYDKANFYVDDSKRTFINDEQIEWFKADLKATQLPTIVFSHQSLWHYHWGVKNRLELQKIMEEESAKVICCMNGHNHIDYHHQINGIDYIEINSMSYNWTSKYTSEERFDKKYYEQYKNLPHIAGYQDPLFAFATLDPKGSLHIEGVKSQWMHPSPYELGMSEGMEGSVLTAEISDYILKF